MPLKEILAAQDRWAQSQWPGHFGRRAPSLRVPVFPKRRSRANAKITTSATTDPPRRDAARLLRLAPNRLKFVAIIQVPANGPPTTLAQRMCFKGYSFGSCRISCSGAGAN